MLVCNVSLRPPRSAIAADIAEAIAAVDASATGNVVFATLVDDPASVGEIVDAYLGNIMLEAASADAIVDGGLGIAAAIDEVVTATDTSDGTVTTLVYVTWEAASVASVTLSGGDLVATNTGTTSANQGAHVPSTAGKTSGKFYFECTFTTVTGGGNSGFGPGTTGSSYTNMGNGGTVGSLIYRSGNIYVNGTYTGITLSIFSVGLGCGIAVDLDNLTIWYRKLPTGNWNNSGTANPATNTGGITIPAGTMIPFCTFGGSGGVAGNVMTANFGASAFAGSVPSGFTSGWPA